MICVVLALCLAVSSAFAEEGMLHRGGTKMSGYQRTFVCDYCEKTRELWFAVYI